MARNDNIYERYNGSAYQVKLNYTDRNGEPKTISKSFKVKAYGTKAKTLEMARKYRDEMKVKIAGDQVIQEKKASVLQIYKKTMDLHQATISTRRKYDSNFYNHIAPHIDIQRDFKSIRFDEIQEQLNAMAPSCSRDMIKRAFAIWDMMYKYAIADDYVIKNETYKVRIPKSGKIIKKKDQTASYSQVMAVLDQIDEKTEDEKDRLLFKSAVLICLYTGMRPSEILALEIPAIDLLERKIKVYQRIGSSVTEAHTIVKVKSDTSVRTIDYPQALDKVFDDLIKASVNGYLFIRSSGKLLNGDLLSDRINKITEGSFHLYSLRHQLTTDLITQGTDLRTIMELMGHSESTMTLYYARSNDQKKKEAIENRIINNAIIA